MGIVPVHISLGGTQALPFCFHLSSPADCIIDLLRLPFVWCWQSGASVTQATPIFG